MVKVGEMSRILSSCARFLLNSCSSSQLVFLHLILLKFQLYVLFHATKVVVQRSTTYKSTRKPHDFMQGCCLKLQFSFHLKSRENSLMIPCQWDLGLMTPIVAISPEISWVSLSLNDTCFVVSLSKNYFCVISLSIESLKVSFQVMWLLN